MDYSSDSRASRRPVFTAWALGYRRYYSPMVHALAGRTPVNSSASPFPGVRDARFARCDRSAAAKSGRGIQ